TEPTEPTEPTDTRPSSNAEVAPRGRAFARIRLEAPAVLTRGDRFVLRQYSPPITIGGGVVLDPAPARTPIRTSAAAARFRRLAGNDTDAVTAFVDERRAAGISVAALASRAGLSSAAVSALLST